MYPVYLAVGLINIFAKSNNYGIKTNDTGMDIRVRRDINFEPILYDNNDYYTADNVRDKRELPYNQIENLESGHNGNHFTRHNHKSHKRRSHNHGMYIPPRTTKTVNNNIDSNDYRPDLTRYKPDNLILETGYNKTRLQKRQSLPTPQPYSIPETTTSKPLYKKIWSFFSGSKTTTPRNGILTPGVGNNNGVSAPLKMKKKRRRIIPACILCDAGCPVGYKRQESFCISNDPDYE